MLKVFGWSIWQCSYGLMLFSIIEKPFSKEMLLELVEKIKQNNVLLILA